MSHSDTHAFLAHFPGRQTFQTFADRKNASTPAEALAVAVRAALKVQP